jgi:hypothetical protein
MLLGWKNTLFDMYLILYINVYNYIQKYANSVKISANDVCKNKLFGPDFCGYLVSFNGDKKNENVEILPVAAFIGKQFISCRMLY